jgi:hypothetical protein
MATLGIKVHRYKVCAAWIGEKAGRVKFNGHLFARSPLSDLEELEILRLGVEGKAAGWRTLRTLANSDTRLGLARLDELISRARRQADVLEDLRVAAASQVVRAYSP